MLLQFLLVILDPLRLNSVLSLRPLKNSTWLLKDVSSGSVGLHVFAYVRERALYPIRVDSKITVELADEAEILIVIFF